MKVKSNVRAGLSGSLLGGFSLSTRVTSCGGIRPILRIPTPVVPFR